MARKSKYDKQIVELICSYIRDGDSQRLACKKAGIGESTFHEWVNGKPEFAEAIKKAKDEFQATIVGKLEATLWKRAMGYEVEETETEYKADADGNPQIKSMKTKKKHILPDTAALIFALTNVAPDKWVNKQRMEMQGGKEESTQNNRFENLPDEILFGLADKLQEAEHEKVQQEKMGDEWQDAEK